jgi:hypothetical protein
MGPRGDNHPSPVAARQPTSVGVSGQSPPLLRKAKAGTQALAKKSSDRVVPREPQPEPDMAREAANELQEGLDSARRLVERARFLLAGHAPPEEEALIANAEPQAASPATSETVQNPSGE